MRCWSMEVKVLLLVWAIDRDYCDALMRQRRHSHWSGSSEDELEMEGHLDDGPLLAPQPEMVVVADSLQL